MTDQRPTDPTPSGPTPTDPTLTDPRLTDPRLTDPTLTEPTPASPPRATPDAPAPDDAPARVNASVQADARTATEPPALREPPPFREPDPTTVPATTTVPAASTEVLEPHRPETAVPASAPQNTVYLHAPTPPRRRSNRGVGVLLAVLATVIFAGLFAVVIAIMIAAREGTALQFGFLSNAQFYVPVLFFLAGFVLLVLIVNRASWWAHVIGSIFVALFVYFGTIGTLLLINGVIAQTPSEAGTMFASALVDPLVVAATLIAREVALWIGFIISARGRRLTARNAEARAEFEAEREEKRAEYDRTSA